MKTYGLIGKSLSHSFSKNYFEKKFVNEGLNDYQYINLEIDAIEQLPDILLKNPTIDGLNVTIPFKEDILSLLDKQSEAVKSIGAANTIKIERDNGIQLAGFNTDAAGFQQSLVSLPGNRLKLSALILGSGGASKAVQHALSELGIRYKIISRDEKPGILSYDQLSENVLQSHHLIINTTPLGMYPHTNAAPPISYKVVTDQHLCYDLIYNPVKTSFLQRCEKQGAVIKNGLEMLQRQADLSWEIWQRR